MLILSSLGYSTISWIAVECPDGHYREQLIHFKLLDQRVNGEWYFATTDQVHELMKQWVEGDGGVFSGRMEPWSKKLLGRSKPDPKAGDFYTWKLSIFRSQR